jgi:hypothetical protein
MSDNLPYTEFPAHGVHLAETLALAREHVELRLGYPIELALLEPVECDGHLSLRAHWRRRIAELKLAS